MYFFEEIISQENLYKAWQEFLRGKSKKLDVAEFNLHLSSHIFNLHEDLRNKKYIHGEYEAFSINDPKPRSIHKATIKDRLLHHAIYRVLYPYFNKLFIYESYSCRNNKGTHRAMSSFKNMEYEASYENTKTLWVLKCDIKKFFASVDQGILIEILRKYIQNKDTLWLLKRVIESFCSTEKEKGLPLGNLTSQLLVNIYMNEFDQWMKNTMNIKYYIRYADDFVILSTDKNYLLELVPKILDFLEGELKLSLHPDKVFIKTFASGVDFLGWVHFPNHRVLRTSTKKRMFKKILKNSNKTTIISYLGLLKHGNTSKIIQKIKQIKIN